MCVFDYNNKLKGMSSVAASSYENHEEGKARARLENHP